MNRLILFTMITLFSIFSRAQSPYIKQLDPSGFHEILLREKGSLLDVRTPSEFSNGHIKDAGQLNYYASDFKKRLLMLPKNQPVYLYCNTGYRSQRAAEILAQNGYKQVYNLEHGIMAWNLNSLPVVVEPDAKPDTENKMEPDEFFAFVHTHSLTFVDYYAPWCGPCRQMMPIIDLLQTEYKNKFNIIKVNADASSKLVKEQKISGVPYFVLYKNGEIVYTHSGLLTREELIQVLESNKKL
jgi:thioredoxin